MRADRVLSERTEARIPRLSLMAGNLQESRSLREIAGATSVAGDWASPDVLRHTWTFTGSRADEEVRSVAWLTGRSWKNPTRYRSDALSASDSNAETTTAQSENVLTTCE